MVTLFRMTGSSESVSESARGVTIVTASMNRTDNLLKSLRSWLLSPATEVIILDYSSENPIESVFAKHSVHDERLRIVRVEGKSRWHLSEAFNMAISEVSNGFVLKLDADIELSKPDLKALKRDTLSFTTGDWANAVPSQMYTNGSLFCHVDHLKCVGGWDRRIRTYGWEDSDLYERLLALGLQQNYFPKGFLHHLDHSDSERTNLGIRFEDSDRLLRANTQANRIASEADFPWKGPLVSPEESKIRTGASGSIWPGLPAQERAILCVEVLEQELAKRDPDGHNTVAKIPAGVKQRIRSSIEIIRRKTVRFRPGNSRAKNIVVKVEHGLGNRLRALASGFQVAQRRGAELTVVWVPDTHCEARLTDLFHWAGPLVESEEELRKLLASDDFQVFDWSVSMSKQSETSAEFSRRPLYIQSSKSFMMVNAESWRIANRFLKQLIPTDPVQKMMREISRDFSVGIHVRQVGGYGFEHLAFESSDNWGHEAQTEIDSARRSVRSSDFIDALEFFRRSDHSGVKHPVFVAADNQKSKGEILAYLGKEARSLVSNPESRGVANIQEALAEMYALASCRLLIGSVYSAYSEIARRLALDGQVFKMLGETPRNRPSLGMVDTASAEPEPHPHQAL